MTLETGPVDDTTWPRAAELVVSALLPFFPYISMKDIVEHLNEEWGFLLKRGEEEEDELEKTMRFVPDVPVDEEEQA